jgi:hypothetical protein
MKFSRKTIAMITVMAILGISGISVPVIAVSPSAGTTVKFKSSAPTFVGTASAFLTGPTLVTPSTVTSSAAVNTAAESTSSIPSLNPKTYMGADPPPTSLIPPQQNCLSPSSGCDQISLSNGGSNTNPNGINAYQNRLNQLSLGALYTTVEPPDQGLCVGSGYVMQVENVGLMQVFNTALAPVSGVIGLDNLMGLTAKGWSSGGDIMCQYDSANGGHWFITEFVSTTTEASGGPFSGCFVALADGCREGIAVSVTNNPMGSYYVYFLDPNKVNSDTGAGTLLNDYAKTATTRDAFLLFYDEYDLLGPFNGVQQFAFSKNALELGHSKVNVAYENMGTNANLAIPANGVYQPSPLPSSAWYQVIPAQTTDPSQYDNSNGGTGFMVASLDFLGNGDNRTGVFDWTGLSALNSAGCSKCGDIAFGGQLLTGHVTYQNEGAPCLVDNYFSVSTFCGLGAQKAGPIPLGDACVANGLATGVVSCPESGIATNGDGATQAFYSNGMLWTAVSTVVNQTYGRASNEYHLGATFWGIAVMDLTLGVRFTIAHQGVVSAMHEDMEFPSVAATAGGVLMAFTLSGNGGPTGADNGGFYPSTAYLLVGSSNVIHIADRGAGAQDGFSEYQGYSVTGGDLATRPRWGDYNQAVFDPTTGKFYFATETISHPNCGDAAYNNDPTCGGTRAPSANWGNSLNSVAP